MATKQQSKTVADPNDFAYKFLRFIETQAKVKEDKVYKSTDDRAYFGIRVEDQIQLELKGRIYTTTPINLWRAYGQTTDLVYALNQLASTGRIVRYGLRGKTDATKNRSYGTKYWTKENSKFLSVRGLSAAEPNLRNDLPTLD